jgi:F-type H+-transporting ATPase subunit delta
MSQLFCYKPEAYTFARPYAKAIFSYAKANNELSSWQVTLEKLACLLQDSSVANWIDAAEIDQHETIAKVISTQVSQRFNQPLTTLIELMLANKRLSSFTAMALLFEKMLLADQKKIKAMIRSAYELDSAQKASIDQLLKKQYVVEAVDSQYSVDKHLIAGIGVEVNDDLLMYHLPSRLSLLKQSLQTLVNQR